MLESSVKIKSGDGVSQLMKLVQLMQYPDECCMDIELSNKHTLVLKVKKSQKGNKGITEILLSAPLSIKNCIRQPVILNLNSIPFHLPLNAIFESTLYNHTHTLTLSLAFNQNSTLSNPIQLLSYKHVMPNQSKAIYQKIINNHSQVFSLFYQKEAINIKKIYLF